MNTKMINMLMMLEIVIGSISHIGLAEALHRKMGRYRILWWNYLSALIISMGIFIVKATLDNVFPQIEFCGKMDNYELKTHLLLILFIGFMTGGIYLANYVTIQRSIYFSGVSTTNMISRLGSFIVSLFVSLLWNEHLSFLNLLGIVLACTAIFLFQDGNVYISRILPILFVISGLQNILKKMYVLCDDGTYQSVYYLGIYTTGLMLCSILLFKRREKIIIHKGEMLIGSIIGAASVFTTYSMVYVLRYLPVAIVTPIVSGGGILFITFISVIRFKEKINLKKEIGLVVTIVSIILML